ncbi:MAG: DUF4173 domain-containing protein [Stecheria intestinalis]|nr:DUF4173 domain-containing protein [Stecheria intestinalis]
MKTETQSEAFFIAAIVSYFFAFFYVKWPLGNLTWPIITIAYLFLNDWFASVTGHERTGESIFWAVIMILQSIALAIYGPHEEILGFLQMFLMHAEAVYFVISRTDLLAASKTSSFLPEDLIFGFFVLPWSHLFLRLSVLKQKGGSKHALLRNAGYAVLILVIVLFALGQLSEADEAFASSLSWLKNSVFFPSDFLLNLVLSIPIGMWLYGLCAGAMSSRQKPEARLIRHKVPSGIFQILFSILTVIYLVFFLFSLRSFQNAFPIQTEAAASEFEVRGFWNLIAILILNFALLAAAEACAESDSWKLNCFSWLILVFDLSGICFAVLDGMKLYLYAHLFGATLRRFYAAWALGFFSAAAIAMLVRHHREFPLTRFLVLGGMSAFTVLSLLNSEHLVLREALKQQNPDLQVLEECRFYEDPEVIPATKRLAEQGWFSGKSFYDISQLYGADAESDGSSAVIALNGSSYQLVLNLSEDGEEVISAALAEQ